MKQHQKKKTNAKELEDRKREFELRRFFFLAADKVAKIRALWLS